MFQETRIGDVWAATHIHVFLVEIHTHRLNAVVHVVNQTQFVFFATISKNFNHFCARQHFFNHIIILINQLLHALFNRCHVFGCEWFFGGDVVVETFVNHWSNNHFCIRKQLFHSVPNQMRTRMADNFHAVLVVGCDDLHGGVFGNRVARIAQHTVDFTCHSRFGKTCANRLRNLHHSSGRLILAHAAVW